MFFQKPAFGVDISDYSIEIVSLGGSFANPKLLAMGRKVLEPGIFISGSVLGKDKLKENLKELLQNLKFGKLNSKRIVSSVPESKSYIHIFELPQGLDKKETENYIRSQAKENFPYSSDELYFDYQIQNGKVLLAACPKKIVEDYLEVFRDCGLDPASLEVESLSLGRALIQEGEKENILIADLGARTTNFSLFSAGKLKFSFSLSQAGNNFTQALSEKLGIPLPSAEKLKKEIGLDPQYQEGRMFLVLQKEIQPIVEGARKILVYFREKTGGAIKKIILAGGSSDLSGLPGYLSANLGLPVEIGDPWVRIDIDILKRKE
ncbi:MAG: type IV pilus assembly protein PilM [bacterium]|nr:type IV pilus assembly protein PilM [bacterium]